jgi:hypothetical protein
MARQRESDFVGERCVNCGVLTDADWLPPSARGAAFLQAHPEVWRDYDGTTAAKQYVFERMQEAGIFAPKTSHHDVNFRWIEAAMRVAD